MIIIDNVKYLTEKEVSAKYGLSVAWFRKRRHSKCEPKYHKLNGSVFYTTECLDNWFKNNMKTI